jgi:uncharacterized protein (DUF486 family)
MNSLPISLQAIGLLVASNVFMTVAWYGHLKSLADKPWYTAALISWGIALFFMNQRFKLDFLWAGLCLVGAVYFIFCG